MSMNKFMHPRNIYKNPPDFKQLAREYEEFGKYAKLDISGKVHIDFKDTNAIRALSTTLLKKDFELEVCIPSNKLIPTIPLRFNYVLWIEDLLSISDCVEVVRGIDIGTGASCVYPLICAKKYNWHILATESDESSVKSAQENVTNNNLNNLITIVPVKGDAALVGVVGEDSFDFTMCNPPFFGSSQELQPSYKARQLSRPKPKNAFCATMSEVVAKGGEVEFVSKIIKESKELNTQIRVYTTMIGQKCSLPPLKRLLREMDIASFKQTEFCQGNTTRWGLAWTYCNIDLRKIPQSTLMASKKMKHKPPLSYLIDSVDSNLVDVTQHLIQIFNELSMSHKLHKNKKHVTFIVKAYTNTWSHQRRKRREQQRLKTTSESEIVNKIEESEIIDNMNNMKVNSPNSSKRNLEEDDSMEEYYNAKRFCSDNNNKAYLEFMVKVYEEGQFLLELYLLNECSDKDSLNQILQYIKNNLKV